LHDHAAFRRRTTDLLTIFVVFLLCGLLCPAAGADTKPAQVLTTVRQVRSLSSEQAKQAQPVHVRGLVMVLSGWKNSFFLQDASGGISVDRQDASPELHSGDEVEITGQSAPGLFAPVIISTEIHVLGTRQLPEAPLRRFDELAGGQQDGQWVEVRGIVHSASVGNSWGRDVLFLEISLGGGTISARVQNFPTQTPASLVDAEVVVRGVCGTNFNERRQFVGLRLFVHDLADVHVLHAAPADPFSVPTQSVESVLQFAAQGPVKHRIKVEGTVTFQQPGRFLYIQNGGDGIYVESDQNTAVSLGDRVEVVGFSALGPYSPKLQTAIFRVLDHGASPPPLPLEADKVIAPSAEGFLTAPYDGQLIRVRGQLIERLTGPEDETMILLQGRTPFRGHLSIPGGADPLRYLENGSVLELTGVCAVRTGQNGEPRIFEIQLRSANDVVLLQAPAWWNLRRTLQLLGFVGLLALVSAAWIVLLHKRVREQTSVIREKAETLRRSEERLRLVLSNVKDYAIMMLDPAGLLVSWNEGAERIFGYRDDEILGRPLCKFFPDEAARAGDPEAELTQAKLTGRCEVEGWRLRKDGSRFWANAITTPLYDEQGRLRGFGRITRDITERKLAEEATQRNQREQIRIKDQILSHVSHELRTPVAAIAWFTGNLQEGLLGALNPEQAEHLDAIVRNAGQLNKMIDDLLDSTRAESGKLLVQPSAFDPRAAIEGVLASCQSSASHKSIHLRADVPSGLPLVWADPQRTNQVFINLIENAIKFTPKDGSVTVSARIEERDPDFLRFTVADTGPGISIADQERIFARLVQLDTDVDSSRKGLGLGLFLCKELVTRQGGKINVESTPGKGASFSFTLPILSIRRFAATLLSPKNLQVGSFGLLSIDPISLSSRQDKARLLTEIHTVLQGCILADLDVLFPRLGDADSLEPFHILACADRKGLQVMSTRIQDQLAANPLLSKSSVRLKVDCEQMKFALRPESSSAEWLEEIVARVTDRISATTTQKG
jgi:PAS domain S-box-containing protein